MAKSSGSVVDNMSAPSQSHVCLLLNSTCVTAGQLHRLALALGVSVLGSMNDQRLTVEGKLTDKDNNPRNVQLVLVEYVSEAAFVLWDEEGEFLTLCSCIHY